MELAQYIDHTLLKPDATEKQITAICDEAKQFNLASVCVNPTHVKLVETLLKNSKVKVCTVVGFPLGASSSQVKAFETEQAIKAGATEIDMVINVGALKDGTHTLVEQDIAGVVNAAHKSAALCKVIIETSLLTQQEKIKACQLSQQAGADFVKTSTDFNGGGATVEDISLMRKTVGPDMGVKASGGIKTYADAQNMIQTGATRLGASAGVKIIQEALSQ